MIEPRSSLSRNLTLWLWIVHVGLVIFVFAVYALELFKPEFYMDWKYGLRRRDYFLFELRSAIPYYLFASIAGEVLFAGPRRRIYQITVLLAASFWLIEWAFWPLEENYFELRSSPLIRQVLHSSHAVLVFAIAVWIYLAIMRRCQLAVRSIKVLAWLGLLLTVGVLSSILIYHTAVILALPKEWFVGNSSISQGVLDFELFGIKKWYVYACCLLFVCTLAVVDRRLRPGSRGGLFCHQCGYPIVGLRGNQCPECGGALTASG